MSGEAPFVAGCFVRVVVRAIPEGILGTRSGKRLLASFAKEHAANYGPIPQERTLDMSESAKTNTGSVASL
jgi:hypothetical protein